MKLMTAVKRLEKDFGMVGVDYRVKTWEMYQPTSFWLITDKYFITVLTTFDWKTNRGFYLKSDEFSKEQVDFLATKQPYVRLEISLKTDKLFGKKVRFRVRNEQGFKNVLDKLDNDPKYKDVFTEGA
jgi:hypothetical protein